MQAFREQKKILHITPHFGGGVGTVILNYLEKIRGNPYFLHKVICLDYANDKARLASKKIGFPLEDKMSSKHDRIIAEIAQADIVLIHWWNHPLLYDFLVREQLPPSRVIMWSHISGFYPPYVFTKKILQYPDRFIFTTPVSFDNPEVGNLSEKQKQSLCVVWSTAGVEYVKSIKPKRHSGFNIGYIGTVDYSKLHPDFLDICKRINIPNVKFIVCGGPREKEIKKEAERLGIADKFKFTGPVRDVTRYLAIFDIFGYPLSPRHYGTCDQVLVESMAAGVVPVVLPNRMEKYMVKNGTTGIVAKNKNDYVKAIVALYKNKLLRDYLSKGARDHAIKNFSTDKVVQDWGIVFKEAMVVSKTPKQWKIAGKNNKISSLDVFLESLGDYGKFFIDYYGAQSRGKKIKAAQKIIKLNESAIWKADTKGSVHQYSHFFPKDKNLSFLSRLMKDGE